MPRPKRKQENYFFLGILISVLTSIALTIWSNYLIKFFDMLPYTEPSRTYITVIGGFFVIVILIAVLWYWATKKY